MPLGAAERRLKPRNWAEGQVKMEFFMDHHPNPFLLRGSMLVSMAIFPIGNGLGCGALDLGCGGKETAGDPSLGTFEVGQVPTAGKRVKPMP